MKSKKSQLEESRLYLILDKQAVGEKPLSGIAAKLRGCGIDIIQLRDKVSGKETVLKNAFLLRKSLLNTKTLFIINDYMDIAKIVNSDGIHLGQKDISVGVARRILGRKKIIGVSCHSLRQAIAAEKSGADYIGIGPIFLTPTKPEYRAVGLKLLRQIKDKIKIPYFAIGDINKRNLEKVLSFGAKRVALCRAILKERNMCSAARYFSRMLH